MLTKVRRTTIAAAAVVAAGALAFTTPTMANGLFDAHNAEKLGGMKAGQLTKIQSFADDTVFDDFDTCAYTTVLSRTFKAPRTGVVSVVGQVGAARDTDNANEGTLTGHVEIDGLRAGTDTSTNLENDGTKDSAINPIGARVVGRGVHTLELKVEECGPGMAFIHAESMVATFSPFGAAPATPPVGKAKVSVNR
ncbi:MAG: hypothetical protein U0R80_16670 [Nocardioidaceae bacterium]